MPAAIDIKVLQTLDMARDRCSHHLREGVAFFTVARGPLGCHTRIRAGFPRHRSRAKPVGQDRLILTRL